MCAGKVFGWIADDKHLHRCSSGGLANSGRLFRVNAPRDGVLQAQEILAIVQDLPRQIDELLINREPHVVDAPRLEDFTRLPRKEMTVGIPSELRKLAAKRLTIDQRPLRILGRAKSNTEINEQLLVAAQFITDRWRKLEPFGGNHACSSRRLERDSQGAVLSHRRHTSRSRCC